MERRPAAVLIADVVGYSSLMEADEVRTLESWKERISTVFKPVVAAHSGRIVNSPGDNVLVEFGNAVDAVAGALEIQRGMVEANHDVPAANRIVVRIGINSGDVIGDGPEIHGEAVNIAARLEPLAEPGGICVSAEVREKARDKLECVFDDVGLLVLKNISRRVGAYRVRLGKSATAIPQVSQPVVLVLPFENKSDDPKQQYLSDGITEDIITELSRYHSLLVIARNSSFKFRGQTVDNKVRKKLGVKYLVEGNVRRLGNRIRIAARLVDAATQHQLWAEYYDRDLQDIFAVQEELAFWVHDELVRIIVATLEGRVAASGAKSAGRKPLQNWDAYDYFLRGRECVNRYEAKEAEEQFRRAIAKEPGYAQAYAWQSLVCIIGDYFEKGEQAKLDEARCLANKALRLDPDDACSYRALGLVSMIDKKLKAAKRHFERAVKLNPTDTFTICLHGLCLAHMGRGGEARRRVREGLRLDPFPPPFYREFLGVALFQLGKYKQAIKEIGKMGVLPWWCHCYLATCSAHLGELEQAAAQIAEVLRLKPKFRIADFKRTEPFNRADMKRLMNGLRKAIAAHAADLHLRNTSKGHPKKGSKTAMGVRY